MIRGLAGEAITFYLSLHGALTQGNEIVYPSSFREDQLLGNQAAIAAYGPNKHDGHTFDSNNHESTTRVSIKSKTGSGNKAHREVYPRFRLISEMTEIYDELASRDSTAPPRGPRDDGTIPRLINLLQQAEQPDSPHNHFAQNLRDGLSARLQVVIGQQENL
jgi:hypothetical protein